jgi:hypothetical protein
MKMKKCVLILLFSFVAWQGFSQNKTYEYDDLNRLSKAHYWENNVKKFTVTYTYDEVGNRLSKEVILNCPSSQIVTELVNSGAIVRQASGTIILQNTKYEGISNGQIGGNNSVTILPNTLIDTGTTFIINTVGCQ